MQNSTTATPEEKELLTLLQKCLSYNPETGLFCRLNGRPTGGALNGQPGHLSGKGYHVIEVLGKNYKAHRLAWLIVHGSWPEAQIDHINGSRTDNRIANLRDVSQSTNMQNQRRAVSTSKSGLLGVTTTKRPGVFVAAIKTNDKGKYLGTFSTPEAAHDAYVDAKRAIHTGCTI